MLPSINLANFFVSDVTANLIGVKVEKIISFLLLWLTDPYFNLGHKLLSSLCICFELIQVKLF